MNKNQKTVIWAALMLFVLTMFRAPWVVHEVSGLVTSHMAIFAPPVSGQLMVSTLLVEWAAIGIIAGVLVLLFRKPL